MNAKLDLTANLGVTVIRADGTHRDVDLGYYYTLDPGVQNAKTAKTIPFWRKFWHDERGIVTTAAVNYLAADFLAASSNRINAFKYHDCGTGTTAAAIGDTGLVTPAGVTRVAGTDTNPSAGQYRSVATISFTGNAAITEWGLFSASTSGTLWDRRVFSAINVADGDSIAFTYTVTCTAGGS